MGLKILVCAITGWLLAGILKLVIKRIIAKEWQWGLIFSSGGMPSSHSAFVSALSMAVGLYVGFNTAEFAIAFALGVIVAVDAVGVRRQAGIQAQRINMIINDLFKGKPLTEKQLKEVLGHSPFEVAAGITTGCIMSLLIWLLWK